MSEQPTRPKRTIILPPDKRSPNADVTLRPSVENLLNSLRTIIDTELARYSSKVSKGLSLSPSDARIVQGYVDSLVKLSKESREQIKHEKLDELSDTELFKEYIKSIGKENAEILIKSVLSEAETKD